MSADVGERVRILALFLITHSMTAIARGNLSERFISLLASLKLLCSRCSRSDEELNGFFFLSVCVCLCVRAQQNARII